MSGDVSGWSASWIDQQIAEQKGERAAKLAKINAMRQEAGVDRLIAAIEKPPRIDCTIVNLDCRIRSAANGGYVAEQGDAVYVFATWQQCADWLATKL